MKILVFSDSHEMVAGMLQAVEAERPDMVLHLGDHESDCEDIALMHPDLPLRTVRGNCDRGSQGLDLDEFVLDGVRFLMTHGHGFGVKMSLVRLRDFAAAKEAAIVLFGHTHIPLCEKYIDNITYLNPGSIGMGSKSYGVIVLQNGKFECEIKK